MPQAVREVLARQARCLAISTSSHKPPADAELVPQGAFPLEAVPFVQAHGCLVGAQHAQAQLARAAGTRMLLGRG